MTLWSVLKNRSTDSKFQKGTHRQTEKYSYRRQCDFISRKNGNAVKSRKVLSNHEMARRQRRLLNYVVGKLWVFYDDSSPLEYQYTDYWTQNPLLLPFCFSKSEKSKCWSCDTVYINMQVALFMRVVSLSTNMNYQFKMFPGYCYVKRCDLRFKEEEWIWLWILKLFVQESAAVQGTRLLEESFCFWERN
jgi:hypothetical protein